MKALFSYRLLNLAAFAACTIAMLYALYLEHYQWLEPCPLCIFQRVATVAAGLLFLLAGLHNPGRLGRALYALPTLLATGFGVFVAGRHVWLQSLPADQVPACGPNLGYMMRNFPLQDVIQTVLNGSGECAQIDWTFLTISLPGWVLIMFIGLTLVALGSLFTPTR